MFQRFRSDESKLGEATTISGRRGISLIVLRFGDAFDTVRTVSNGVPAIRHESQALFLTSWSFSR